VAALPFAIINRAVAYNLIGNGAYHGATRQALLIAALVTPVVLVGVPALGGLGAAYATLCAESLASVVLGLLFVRSKWAATQKERLTNDVSNL
jgi:Na+-driven multidrug efflux pump